MPLSGRPLRGSAARACRRARPRRRASIASGRCRPRRPPRRGRGRSRTATRTASGPPRSARAGSPAALRVGAGRSDAGLACPRPCAPASGAATHTSDATSRPPRRRMQDRSRRTSIICTRPAWSSEGIAAAVHRWARGVNSTPTAYLRRRVVEADRNGTGRRRLRRPASRGRGEAARLRRHRGGGRQHRGVGPGRRPRRSARGGDTAATRRCIDDPDVQVVHNATPNHLHYEVTSAALAKGQARRLGQAAGDDGRGIEAAGRRSEARRRRRRP